MGPLPENTPKMGDLNFEKLKPGLERQGPLHPLVLERGTTHLGCFGGAHTRSPRRGLYGRHRGSPPGSATDDTPGGSESTGGPGTTAPPANPNEATTCAERPDPGNVLIRRLTHDEYDNTVRDLVGDISSPGNRFPSEGNARTGFDNEAAALSVSPLLIQNYADAAQSLVETLMTTDKKKSVVI